MSLSGLSLISLENQDPRVWRKNGETQKPSCLKSQQSVMIGDPCPLLVLSTVFDQVQSQLSHLYKDILEHFMLRSAGKLYGDADFNFQQDLAPKLNCEKYQYLV